MTFIDAARSQRRKTGEIKLHGEAAFEGMRRAGRLTAEALDMLHEHVRPGVPTARIDRLVYEFAMDHGAMPATNMWSAQTEKPSTTIAQSDSAISR